MTAITAPSVHLLIVDSDPVVLSVLNEQLQSEGFQVSTASTSAEGLQSLQEGAFSVVLAAQELEGMTGIELLAKVKERHASAVRILSSSSLSLIELCEAVKSGAADRFIVKPWLREELLTILRNTAALQFAKPAETDEGFEETGAPSVESAAENAPEGSQGTITSEEGGDALVKVFTRMLAAFHPNLGNSAERTMALCEVMGKQMNWPADKARSFRWAGGLHAIGLIHIERAVVRRWLRSAEKCTDEKLNQIKRHPKESAEMLEPWPIFKEASEIICSYREHWDGTGFPDRLKAEAIPTMSRFLAPAVYFASRHQNAQHLFKDLQSQAEVMFDPKPIDAVINAAPATTMPRGIREILLIELEQGMVLARDISNTSGLCIIAKDKELTTAWINKISNINNATPLKPFTMVYC